MPIAASTVGLVMLAAVLHAGWNALGKSIPDRLASAALIGVAYAVLGALATAFVPVPLGAAWPFLLASAIVQTLYLLLLMSAYRNGEFGRTYPLTRGLSPLLVTAVSITVLGERSSWAELCGIALVCGGLTVLVLAHGMPRRGSGYGLAALTGVTIAAYSLIDGVGVRRSGAPIGYAAWLFVVHGVLVVLVAVAIRRRHGGDLLATVRPHWRRGLVGGVLSVIAYGIVVWAQARTPLAAVATLRETSVVLAAFFGRMFFAERLGVRRVGAAAVVAAGIVAIATAGG